MGLSVKEVEAVIDLDPFDSALYEVESGRNPAAKNPDSTASGAFQLLAATWKAFGVTDPFDLEQNYKAYLKLKAENIKRFGSDPVVLYAAHYLGATLLDKWQRGSTLSKKEDAQVKFFVDKAYPRFWKIYEVK